MRAFAWRERTTIHAHIETHVDEQGKVLVKAGCPRIREFWDGFKPDDYRLKDISEVLTYLDKAVADGGIPDNFWPGDIKHMKVCRGCLKAVRAAASLELA